VADLYTLQKSDVVALERVADRSAQNLLDQIERSKGVPLARFLNALGVPQVGEATAQLLAEHFGSFDALMRASRETLEAIPNIGPSMAEDIYNFFHEKHNREIIRRLLKAGVRPVAPRQRKKASALAGKTFVLTGALESMTREEVTQQLQAVGAKVASAVSRKTDYVVIGTDPGSKATKAAELGIETLSEKQFLKLIK
jgi:DNA ligase (NAD+)